MKEQKILLGENIKTLRRSKDISQEDLASLCSLHRTYIGSVERGERNVSLTNIVLIARALNTSPSNLLKGIN